MRREAKEILKARQNYFNERDIDFSDYYTIEIVKENYILLKNHKNNDCITYEVLQSETENFSYPNVYIDHNYRTGEIEKVEINWASYGSKSTELTKEFLQTINEAIEFAEEIKSL